MDEKLRALLGKLRKQVIAERNRHVTAYTKIMPDRHVSKYIELSDQDRANYWHHRNEAERLLALSRSITHQLGQSADHAHHITKE